MTIVSRLADYSRKGSSKPIQADSSGYAAVGLTGLIVWIQGIIEVSHAIVLN